MGATENSLELRRRSRDSAGGLIEAVISSRFAIYLTAIVAAVATNCLLGKESMGDTLNYHLYAGFSALHDRFGQDYFPAGPQSYFNPYVYVPFYLLARSGLSALAASSLLAAVQSAVLWLTYEIALEVAPSDQLSTRRCIGVCAAVLAFANPILIGQLGSSFADLPTAELVLVGWLLLLRAIRSPSAAAVVGAGLVLGAASALKLTNSGHALCGFVLLAFVPGDWRGKLRFGAEFGAALAAGFLVIAAPWALHLERQFGNPLFPLLNGLFQSPQYPTTGMLDSRFIPDSISAALWRPFGLLAPTGMVDNEFPSPDLRYALLSILAIAMALRWLWLRARRSGSPAGSLAPGPSASVLVALGCAFLADWILWLTVSGNGRYFIAMACIAAILAAVMLFRVLALPRVRTFALIMVLCAQAAQLSMAAVFRAHVRWDGGPWFEVSVPRALARASNLYLTFGDGSSTFIAPYLSSRSGIVNIGGTYELGPRGANGARVESLLHRYAPHLQVLMRDPRIGTAGSEGLPDFRYVDDALEPFALRVDPGNCARIVVRDVVPGVSVPAATAAAPVALPTPDTGYLVSCQVVPDHGDRSALLAGERAADVVFDRIEGACPKLFAPAHQVSRNYSGRRAQVWVRQYSGTGLDIFIGPGGVEVANTVRGGPPDYLGRESDWLKAPLRLKCGRLDQRYYARVP